MSGGAPDGVGESDPGHDPARVALAAPAGRLRRPARLRAGDQVAVVATSGPVSAARLEAGCAVLRELGLHPIPGKHVLDHTGLGPGGASAGPRGLAGGDADRAADLRAAWCDPGIRAIVCARGGYGATRVLDHLDWAALAEAADLHGPTLLHGSSDITALHAAFAARLGVTTSFGPMAGGLLADLPPSADAADAAAVRAHLLAGLTGDGAPVPGARALRGGRAEGPLTGGTLSLLVALLGTPYAPRPAGGGIAFLEDVDEAPYRVDRMLTQLLQAGWFSGVAGVALGTWIGCGEPEALNEVFTGRLGGLGVPVLTGLPVGHGPRQLTLELGGHVRLDADALLLTPSSSRGGAS